MKKLLLALLLAMTTQLSFASSITNIALCLDESENVRFSLNLDMTDGEYYAQIQDYRDVRMVLIHDFKAERAIFAKGNLKQTHFTGVSQDGESNMMVEFENGYVNIVISDLNSITKLPELFCGNIDL